jgi:GNAT superfamily N-acetyltransferase
MNSPSSVEPPGPAFGRPDDKLRTQTDVFRLPCGESVMVRAISPQDADRLQAYMRNLSGPTRRNRFLGAVNELAPKELERLTHMGGPGELAWIAFGRVDGETAMIAEAIQAMAPQNQRCEIALSVTDAWQRKGVGTLLLSHMECRARLVGVRYLVGDVLRTNDAMKGLARKAGFAIRGPFKDARLIEIVKDLSSPPTGLPCREQFSEPQLIAA